MREGRETNFRIFYEDSEDQNRYLMLAVYQEPKTISSSKLSAKYISTPKLRLFLSIHVDRGPEMTKLLVQKNEYENFYDLLFTLVFILTHH